MPTASSCAASPSSATSSPPPSPWASVNARRWIWPGPQPASQCDRLTDRTSCRILGKDTRSSQEEYMVALTAAIQKAIDTARAADNGRHAELIINDGPLRSEEHTSELQSRGHLVCRLLLEKKKTRAHNI